MAEDQKTALQLASDRIRETAKWLVVALAALGGVLTAGMQLSSLGSLPSSSQRWPAAIGGGILALVGAGIIIGLSVWISTTPVLTFSAIVASARKKSPRAELTDSLLLQEFSSIGELDEKLQLAYAAVNRAADRRLDLVADDPPANPSTTHNSKALNSAGASLMKDANLKVELEDEELARLHGIAKDVTEMASYFRLGRRWKLASLGIGIGATGAIIGVTYFIWAINPPAEEKASSASPVVLSAVSSGTLTLTAAGKAAIAASQGPACATKTELSVLVLGTTPSGPDLLLEEPGCSRTRLVLGSEWGTLSNKT